MINLANDENDDWMKKARPAYREEEKKAFEAALEMHNGRKEEGPPQVEDNGGSTRAEKD